MPNISPIASHPPERDRARRTSRAFVRILDPVPRGFRGRQRDGVRPTRTPRERPRRRRSCTLFGPRGNCPRPDASYPRAHPRRLRRARPPRAAAAPPTVRARPPCRRARLRPVPPRAGRASRRRPRAPPRSAQRGAARRARRRSRSPAPLVNRALADVAGRPRRARRPRPAARPTAASPAGAGRRARASRPPRQRARVAEATRAALQAGFAGVCLDRPDAPLALGLLGAGFCPECQRDLARHLAREYGEHFQPVDYLALAREAIAQAVGRALLRAAPLRPRLLARAQRGARPRGRAPYARDARDAARAAARPFEVVAQFEALGPGAAPRGPRTSTPRSSRRRPRRARPALGLFRLLRARDGAAPLRRRPARRVAAAAPRPARRGRRDLRRRALRASSPPATAGATSPRSAASRAGSSAQGPRPRGGDPVAECAILYSAEADLWTRRAPPRRGRARRRGARGAARAGAGRDSASQDAPAGAALVLAGRRARSRRRRRRRSRRRLEAGGAVLAFGEPARGRRARARPARRSSRRRRPAGRRSARGTLAVLPAARARGRRRRRPGRRRSSRRRSWRCSAGDGARRASPRACPLLVVLHRVRRARSSRTSSRRGERAQGATLFLGVPRRGRARGARASSRRTGSDVRIPMNPSGNSISTVLPAFRGYAVLSLAV